MTSFCLFLLVLTSLPCIEDAACFWYLSYTWIETLVNEEDEKEMYENVLPPTYYTLYGAISIKWNGHIHLYILESDYMQAIIWSNYHASI